MTQQLTLAFDHVGRQSRLDFVSGAANRAAIEAIDRWPDWPSRVLTIIGPEASGKSHLAQIFARASGASVWPMRRADPNGLATTAADLHGLAATAADLHGLAATAAAGAIALEDAGPGLDEAGLFHLINAIEAARGHLLITAREMPARWGVDLADLASRLRAVPPVIIEAPDDRLLEEVIAKQFADRQTVVDPMVIRFMVQRMERSFAAARTLVDRLDREAIARKTGVTRGLVSDLLGRESTVEPTLPGLDLEF